MQVGIRELKADLSAWVKRAAAGEPVVVTDRGRPVARIVPVDGERTIDRLIRAGAITPALRPHGALPVPVDATGTVSDLVAEQRG